MEYAKPFLTQVIFQANYDIEALKTSIDPSLVELCKQKTGVPHLSELKNTSINISNQRVQSDINSQWLFKGSSLEILIQHNLIQIINRKYTNHNNFHPIIEEVFNLVRDIYKPIITRIALRYINNISFPDGGTYEFNDLINSSLLSPTLEYKDCGLTRSIGVMNFYDEDITTNFTYGFVNSEFPNRIAKREFILDYDCFVTLRNTIESMQPIILKLRNRVNFLFEKSILNDLRLKMQ